jgi:BMFP domain-containing protein YqiC
MSTGPNRILDEVAKMMTDAAGAAQGVRREVEGAFRSQGEKFLNSMDLVKREEFDAVMEMAANARAENEAQAARLAALEARIAVLEAGVSDSAPAKVKKSPDAPAKTK